MVCLGNICRSPMAQGMMEYLIAQRGLDWKVDSAGTNGYHNGEAPDPRAVAEAARNGIDISGQISRKISVEDLDRFDFILAMDENNYHYLQSMARTTEQSSKIQLFMSYAAHTGVREVPDPYYDGRFAHALQLIREASEGLIKKHQLH